MKKTHTITITFLLQTVLISPGQNWNQATQNQNNQNQETTEEIFDNNYFQHNYHLVYEKDNDGKFVLNLCKNLRFFNHTFMNHHSDETYREIRRQILQEVPERQLDNHVWKDGSSMGHLFLHRNEPENFRIWLQRGAQCTATTDNNSQHCKFNNETILTVLCLKGTDQYPDLVDLMETVLQRNPQLLYCSQNNSFGKSITPAYIVVHNSSINDTTTLKILQKIVHKGFNFWADSHLLEGFRSCKKPLSIKYIEDFHPNQNLPTYENFIAESNNKQLQNQNGQPFRGTHNPYRKQST